MVRGRTTARLPRRRRPAGAVTRAPLRRSLLRDDRIAARSGLPLSLFDCEASLTESGQSRPRRMGEPARSFHDLLDRGSVFVLKQVDDFGYLAAVTWESCFRASGSLRRNSLGAADLRLCLN